MRTNKSGREKTYPTHVKCNDASDRKRHIPVRQSFFPEVSPGGPSLVNLFEFSLDSHGRETASHFGSTFFTVPLIGVRISSHSIPYFSIDKLFGNFTLTVILNDFSWSNLSLLSICCDSIWYYLLLSSLSSCPPPLILSLTIISGIGGSCCGNMPFLMIASYFRHNLGLANAVLLTGVGVGSFIGPLYINFFLEQYTFKGAAILYGALVLNGCALSLLYHPVDQHMKKVEIDSEECNSLPLQTDVEEMHNKCTLDAKFEPQNYRNIRVRYNSECKDQNGFPLASRPSVTYSALDIGALAHVSSVLALSSLDINEKHENFEK
ncbi:unnamed protein product, partial [Meganyctiphanes norvegica]